MGSFDYRALQREVAEFAAREIAPRAGLNQAKDFPAELWRAMAEAGLLAIALPAEYGGRDGDYRALAVTMETLADAGGCQGVAISWMSHALLSRLHFLRLGTAEQKSRYLP
ncbi:MAG: acyl-CoA dehydrogenase family protein, partial [Alphaproteobacteria bacterium]|nr:acyl-CoA dehydrogenase family protein [Alphaproteobacteria bacterium]